MLIEILICFTYYFLSKIIVIIHIFFPKTPTQASSIGTEWFVIDFYLMQIYFSNLFCTFVGKDNKSPGGLLNRGSLLSISNERLCGLHRYFLISGAFLLPGHLEDCISLKEETEQAPYWEKNSILGQTADFELYAQYLWKRHTNWKTRPPLPWMEEPQDLYLDSPSPQRRP